MSKPSKKDVESIIPQKKPSECYFCHRQSGLVKHHCLHGRGTRPLAVEDGLWIWICPYCHTERTDSVHVDPEHIKDRICQKLAQDSLISKYVKQGYPQETAREMFLSRYGRFYD